MASWAERKAVELIDRENPHSKWSKYSTQWALEQAIREAIEEAARRAKERGNCPHCARRILALLNDDGADRG